MPSVRRPAWVRRVLPCLALFLAVSLLAPLSPTTSPAIAADNSLNAEEFSHNSRETLYRVPGGSVPANTQVALRFRTASGDATSVTVRTFHVEQNREQLYEMQPAATNVSCYEERLASSSCDFWQTTVDVGPMGLLFYRFIVRDGSSTSYYEDDSDLRDGGPGRAYTTSPDLGWVITVHDPAFNQPIRWMQEGVMYQIFPDRFRNGNPNNDPTPSPIDPRYSIDPRYAYPNGEQFGARPEWDRIVRMEWGELPEGYCTRYEGISDAECPRRFPQPGRQDPGGGNKELQLNRDYYGGDLEGVIEKLDYLRDLGVTILYFNPISWAGSNHRYDTRDYYRIDPYLGNIETFQRLEAEASRRGMRIVLDAVFNHMSSDSPIFDRYRNWANASQSPEPNVFRLNLPVIFGGSGSATGPTPAPSPTAGPTSGPTTVAPAGTPEAFAVPGLQAIRIAQGTGGTPGGCESVDSPYRGWFYFVPPISINDQVPPVCAPGTRDGPSFYLAWSGIDTLPELREENQAVQDFIQASDNSVTRYWLRQGADGWRVDAVPNMEFRTMEGVRQQIKSLRSDAIIIGELWQKFNVLPHIQGNTADTVTNYRTRDAILGLVTPGSFEPKGFPQSGEPISASAFANRLLSVREDYPDAAYYTLMNLIDSHDTDRALWVLTPGEQNRAQRELNQENLAEGKQRLRLAVLLQMTQPGAPVIYYGTEVGLTGDDDPDDRRTFPWGDERTLAAGDRRQPDRQLLAFHTAMTNLRRQSEAIVSGDMRFLLVDDTQRTVAYGRKAGNQAAIVAANPNEEARVVSIPLNGYLPNGISLTESFRCDAPGTASYTVQNGSIQLTIPALCGVILLTQPNADLTPGAAPAGLQASVSGGSVSLTWSATEGATSYNVYRSPVTGGGYVLLTPTPLTATSFTDTLPTGGQRFFYVVKAVDASGNESNASNEASVTR
ncbi:MAG: alpha-amylase family glycosyl hydrolase [Chloroflexaceae bacterium]|nr:alpha-amylase family glycosyl hydrolase [Chloroflexaceae bacterium]